MHSFFWHDGIRERQRQRVGHVRRLADPLLYLLFGFEFHAIRRIEAVLWRDEFCLEFGHVRQRAARLQPLAHGVPHLCPLVDVVRGFQGFAAEGYFGHIVAELPAAVDDAFAAAGVDKDGIRPEVVDFLDEPCREVHVADGMEDLWLVGHEPLAARDGA